MKRVETSEILDLTAYEKIRERYLAETIAMKKNRRIPLGDRLTFIFENRDTVIFQIQEMTRAERSVLQSRLDAGRLRSTHQARARPQRHQTAHRRPGRNALQQAPGLEPRATPPQRSSHTNHHFPDG